MDMSTKIFSGAGAFSKLVVDVQKDTLKACEQTVNIQAANTRKNSVENIQKNFILRNNFTARSITFTQSKGAKTYAQVQSSVGALQRANYMKRQEEGGIKKNANGTNLALATTQARGGSNASTVRQRFRYSEVSGNVVRGTRSSNRKKKSSIVARAFIAHKNKKFLRLGQNLFEVTSFRKTKKMPKFKLKHIYNFDHKTTVTPSDPWLEPASKGPAQQSQAIFNSCMKKL